MSSPRSRVARVEVGRGYASIERADRQRIVSVTADVDQQVTNADQINGLLRTEVLPPLIAAHPGLRYSMEGEQKQQAESLGSLRTILSTGSPLSVERFEYVYRDIKEDLQLASISGGSDINGCFVGGNPMGPVYAGEIQCRCLGMKIEAWGPQALTPKEQDFLNRLRARVIEAGGRPPQ